MSISIHTINYDNVIKSVVLSGVTTYRFAIESIYPLINRFSAQRKLQNPAFYDRLRRDLVSGCIMPPITMALIDEESVISPSSKMDDAEAYCNLKVTKGYVLDGMQRLNALHGVKDEPGFDLDKQLYISLVISPNKDMLLYRMITLNNGQRPMTPRHQIEVLTEELFDFELLSIDVQSEKDRADEIKRGAYSLADISKGYLAFFSNSVHNENNKIISEKMDEIIVEKIMNTKVFEGDIQFQAVLEEVDRLSKNDKCKEWLMLQNNLIGFCVGIKTSYDVVTRTPIDEFATLLDLFEEAFKGINASKVNVGKFRRELALEYIKNISSLKELSATSLLSHFSDKTSN
ncbi:hypothetical protein [Shewanella frigidimarina]|uniref:hypothetical protein n=1 Tax=Shewanella frigidimarina TaxID=56812 RepID=UPI003D79C140